LQALVEAGHKVVAVITAPDKPSGRGLQIQQSPVKQFAVAKNIPVLQPVKLKRPGIYNCVKKLSCRFTGCCRI
jgi:methionyl-tRNA formyltransferase